jgi:hypothetical protein
MSGMKGDARFLSGDASGAPIFLESKPGPGRISLPKDNYENNDLNLPLFDRARLDCVRAILANARAFPGHVRDRNRLGQRRGQHFARGFRHPGR